MVDERDPSGGTDDPGAGGDDGPGAVGGDDPGAGGGDDPCAGGGDGLGAGSCYDDHSAVGDRRTPRSRRHS